MCIRDSYYNQAKIKCKVANGEKNSIFVTAEGLILPCCWTAGRMYKWWHEDPKVEQIWDFIDRAGGKDGINAKIHGIEGVFASGIMQDIQRSWTLKSIKEGKLGVCSMKCGTEFDPFAEQFKQMNDTEEDKVWKSINPDHMWVMDLSLIHI